MKWSCRCGQVEIAAELKPAWDSRLVCYCKSCRAFAEQTGAGNTIDDWGGVDLYQTAVERVDIVKGSDKLHWTKLSEKGPLRWFATCCGAPVANTLSTRQIPFFTLMTDGFESKDALPPVMGRVNLRGATSRIEADIGTPKKAIRAFFWRAAKSRLNGGYKRNPFFDANGVPIVDGPTDPPGAV